MKLWLITFKEHWYDQYDAFVVAADSEDAAIALLRGEYPRYSRKHEGVIDWDGGYVIAAIEPTEAHIVLGSFNAG